MKKYVQNIWVRILAAFLCTVMALGVLISAGLMVFYTQAGSRQDVYESGIDRIASNYAMYVLDCVKSDKEEELTQFLEKTGLNVRVSKVAARTDEDKDESKRTSVLYSNTRDLKEWAYEIPVYARNGSYSYDVENLVLALRRDAYVHFGYDDGVPVSIDGYAYDVNTGIFYYKTKVGYVKVKKIVVEDGSSCDYELVKNSNEEYYYNSFYDWKLDPKGSENWTVINIDGKNLDFDESNFTMIEDSKLIKEDIVDGYYNEIEEVIYCTDVTLADKYIIRLAFKESFVAEEPYAKQDLIGEWNLLLEDIYSYEDDIVGLLISFTIALILMFAFFVATLPDEREKLGFMHRIPLCTYLVSIVGIEALGLLVFLDVLVDGYNRISVKSLATLGALNIGLVVFIGFLALGNIIARLKTKSFWRYSEFHYLFKPFTFVYQYAKNNVPLFWKGLIIFSVIGFVKCLFLFGFRHDSGVLLVMLMAMAVAEVLIIVYVLLQMKELQDGAKRVASGDLSKQVDTSKMFWEFKKHGENINKVSEGISIAVEEQLKSERFKTELITNVSHDIKTPLTSIINYVDLIKKEKVSDETICEYIDVLDRQSSRLKKLIEDLMEASKASTGNLAVHFEECDANMLLMQVVGEFEDKLNASALEVVVDRPANPVSVIADGRHMWRVLDNLLNNACKYSQPNTRVYIELKQEGNLATITFKNISKSALNIPSEELMERFVRGDSSRNTEGSGLGLSIAQSLTELMNGTMRLEIDGDLFKVTLTFNAI